MLKENPFVRAGGTPAVHHPYRRLPACFPQSRHLGALHPISNAWNPEQCFQWLEEIGFEFPNIGSFLSWRLRGQNFAACFLICSTLLLAASTQATLLASDSFEYDTTVGGTKVTNAVYHGGTGWATTGSYTNWTATYATGFRLDSANGGLGNSLGEAAERRQKGNLAAHAGLEDEPRNAREKSWITNHTNLANKTFSHSCD